MNDICASSDAAVSTLQDEELIAAVQERFEVNRRAIAELRDLTDKLEATNRRLQESESLKGHFLSNIRNEITNPLAAIIGFARQLMNNGVSGELAATSGRFIYDEAMELDFQLENAFSAAGLEAGLEMPDPVMVDAVDSLHELIARLEHRSSGRNVSICRNFTAPLSAYVDRRFLRIIVGNLLANAVEFSPPGGVVSLSASIDYGELRIDVTDQGPGIAGADLETVFDRFCQLDRGRCKSHRGLGLGLSVSRALAELAGGSIAVRSAPGSGSTFSLTIPGATVAAGEVTPEESLFGTMERF
jgi:signal transduction histidine kinase